MVFNWEAYLKVSGWSSCYQSIDNFLRYLRDRKSGSEGSRRLYCHTIYGFCSYVKKMPDDLVAMKKSELEKLIEEFGHHKREEGCSAKWVNIMMRNLKSFLKVNGFKGAEEIELEPYYIPARTRVRDEYVPTLEEARQMANVAGCLRDRAIILFMFSTGLRNSTLRAILYGDIKEELESGQSNILVKVTMDMKKIVEAACKGNIEYAVFASSDATEALKLYLNDRRRRLGEISELEILFCTEHNLIPRNERSCTPLTRREIELLVKETARKAGIKDWKNVRPHCLRKTFESILRSRLQDGSRLDVKTQEYFMGHILPGNQDPYYDKSKIEELRKEYAKLVFKPVEQDSSGEIRSLRTVAEALDIDCATLLDSNKKELGRDLTSEEEVSLLKDAVKNFSRRLKGSDATEGKQATDGKPNAANSNADSSHLNEEMSTSCDGADLKMCCIPEDNGGNMSAPLDSGNAFAGAETNGVNVNSALTSKHDVHLATSKMGNSLPGEVEYTIKQLNAQVPESLYLAAKRSAVNHGLKLQVWVSAAVNAFLFLQEHLNNQLTLQLDQDYTIFLLIAARNHLYKQGYSIADLNTEIKKAAEFLKSK